MAEPSMSADPSRDRPLQSKKFVAYLVAEFTWKAALIILLILGIKEAKIDVFLGSIAAAVVIVAGFIEALYIGGQAALDRYTRVAEIVVGAGASVSMKGVNITQAPAKPAPPDGGSHGVGSNQK